MFNGNCEKLWLNMIDHRICGCQLFSDKLIYVYINNPSQDIYIYKSIFHGKSSMGRFTNKQLGCQPLYTISYKQYVAVFKTWNDIPWKTSQLILDSQFMEVSSPVKHHHQQGSWTLLLQVTSGSRWSSHGEPRDVLQQSAVIQFQKSGTNRIQTEQSSHWVSCKRYCSQRERVHTIHNELILHSGASRVNVVETTRKEIGTLHCSYWCLANFPVGKIKLSIWLGIACIFNDFSSVVHVFNCPKLSGLPTLRKIYWVKSSLRLNVLRMRSCPTEHSHSQFFCSVPTVGTLRAPFACSNAYSLLFICVMCVNESGIRGMQIEN